MRRLARHLFTLFSAVSVLLCVAVCVLWVRSYHHMDFITWDYYVTRGDRAFDSDNWGVRSSAGGTGDRE